MAFEARRWWPAAAGGAGALGYSGDFILAFIPPWHGEPVASGEPGSTGDDSIGEGVAAILPSRAGEEWQQRRRGKASKQRQAYGMTC